MKLLKNVKRLNVANADVVVFSACVQMPSLPAVVHAVAILGWSVTSALACTVRNMLDLLGLVPHVEGCGTVLAERKAANNYDVIIVGAAGCVLASRLSADRFPFEHGACGA